MLKRFVKLMNDSEGATAIEYGLIAALIAVAAIGAMRGIGTKLNTTFNNVSSALRLIGQSSRKRSGGVRGDVAAFSCAVDPIPCPVTYVRFVWKAATTLGAE